MLSVLLAGARKKYLLDSPTIADISPTGSGK
jgi:hypothetical protein